MVPALSVHAQIVFLIYRQLFQREKSSILFQKPHYNFYSSFSSLPLVDFRLLLAHFLQFVHAIAGFQNNFQNHRQLSLGQIVTARVSEEGY